MQNTPTITSDELRQKLSAGEAVNIIDIRPSNERAEWFIPGSIHIDVYDKLKHNEAGVFENIQLDTSTPIVTVCGGGKTSLLAADILKQKGYNAFSLEGGMKGWSLVWNLAFQAFPDFEIWQIRRTGKGCLSYMLASNGEALIIDASLPLQVYAELVQKNNLKVKYILETHIHADHLSRSKELADYFQVPLYLPAPNKVQFQFKAVDADTVFTIGLVSLRSIPTPGHTMESFSYYIDNSVLFTGDTLFTNGVGRPDLKSNTEESLEKAKLLFRSLHKLLLLPGIVIVLPAHTNQPAEFDNKLIKTTIAEVGKNISLLQVDEETFIHSLLQKIPPTPPNYLSIIEKNITGHYEDINPVELEAGANRCAVS